MKKKLNQWTKEGLIDQETADRILAYEEANSRPLMIYAMSGLSALSILIGLVAFVAANWDGLPDVVKLGGDLLLGIGLVTAILRNRVPPWGREVLLTVLGGWVLASIALIGQIYQLGGESRDALSLWCLLTVPIFLLGRSRLVASVWFAGYLWSLTLWLEDLSSFLNLEEETLLAFIPAICWALLALLYKTRLGEKRPHVRSVFGGAAMGMLALLASMVGLIGFSELDALSGAQWVALLTTIPLMAVVWKRMFELEWRAVAVATQGLLFFPFILISMGVSDAIEDSGIDVLLGVVTFVGYWGLVARGALVSGMKGLFRFATFLMAIRLIVLYLELFVDLLSTGLVFLSGGVLTLLVIRYWHKKNQTVLTEETTGEEL